MSHWPVNGLGSHEIRILWFLIVLGFFNFFFVYLIELFQQIGFLCFDILLAGSIENEPGSTAFILLEFWLCKLRIDCSTIKVVFFLFFSFIDFPICYICIDFIAHFGAVFNVLFVPIIHKSVRQSKSDSKMG